MNANLSQRIVSALSSSPHASEIEDVLSEARAEHEKLTAKRKELEELLLGDPVALRVKVNMEGGALYSDATAAEKVRARADELDLEIMRLHVALERLPKALEEARARDDAARLAAKQAAELIAAAARALEGRGEALAAEMRDLIRAGNEAYALADAANAALPAGERIDVPEVIARLRPDPERIVSTQEIQVWLDDDTGEVVPEDRLRVDTAWGDTLESLRERGVARIRDGFSRARLTPATEITFIPAYRYDWLNPVPPTQQVRYEKIVKPKRYEISEETIGGRRPQREPKPVSLHPLHPNYGKQNSAGVLPVAAE